MPLTERGEHRISSIASAVVGNSSEAPFSLLTPIPPQCARISRVAYSQFALPYTGLPSSESAENLSVAIRKSARHAFI